jgi:hypothetical protein
MSLDSGDWVARTPEGLPEGWHNDERYIEMHRRMLSHEVESPSIAIPASEIDFGVAVCGGGHRLFTNAYVCMRMLREIGAYAGPIYFWYLGDCEMDSVMKSIVQKMGGVLMDARAMFPDARTLNGWELKAYAVAHTPAKRVFLIDADNSVALPLSIIANEAVAAMRDRKSDAVCAAAWPDYSRLEPDRIAWRMCGLEYRDEPEFESGQLLFDREAPLAKKALAAILHMNNYSDFFYKHVHGDKETFHLGLLAAGAEYAMCPSGIHSLDATMVQHTHVTAQKALFHRNMDKWVLDGSNRVIDGFVVERHARQYLAELRELWTGDIMPGSPSDAANKIRSEVLCRGQWKYERVGHDSRLMTFGEDGRVGYGSAKCEHSFRVTESSGETVVWLMAESGEVIARLNYDVAKGSFDGAWLRYEKMPVTLTRL